MALSSKHYDIVKDVRTAVRLEQELQLSYTNKGVCVVDVYSQEWGSCKALKDTFSRLATEQLDGVPLKFVSAECNAVLKSLKNTEDRNFQRPKNLEAIKDTLPEAWQMTVEKRCGHSKPYFIIFKDGKHVTAVEGVNTPLIRKTLKELCKIKVCAKEVIKDPMLLETWEAHWNPDDSEVTYEKFLKGMDDIAEVTEPLEEEEILLLVTALGIKPEVKHKIVTAAHLQKWVIPAFPPPTDAEEGTLSPPPPPPTRTLAEAFHELLPDYAPRAAEQRTVRLAAEAEQRRIEEEEARAYAVQKAAEEAAAREAEIEARVVRMTELQTNTKKLLEETAQAVTGVEELETEDLKEAETAVQRLHERAEGEALKENEEDMGDAAVAAASAAMRPTGELNLLLHQYSPEEEIVVEKVCEALEEGPSFFTFLNEHGCSTIRIAKVRNAVEDYFVKSHLLADAKLATMCLTATSQELQSIFNASDLNFKESALNGTLIADYKSLASCLVLTSQSDSEALASNDNPATFEFLAPKDKIPVFDALETTNEYFLPPFTPLNSLSNDPIPNGYVRILIQGLPKLICASGPHSLHPASPGLYFNPWFALIRPIEMSETTAIFTYTNPAFEAKLNATMQAVEEACKQNHDLVISVSKLLREYLELKHLESISGEAEMEETEQLQATAEALTMSGQSSQPSAAIMAAAEIKMSRKQSELSRKKSELSRRQSELSRNQSKLIGQLGSRRESNVKPTQSRGDEHQRGVEEVAEEVMDKPEMRREIDTIQQQEHEDEMEIKIKNEGERETEEISPETVAEVPRAAAMTEKQGQEEMLENKGEEL